MAPSSTSIPFRYDVFLSFRGADTLHNFTDHLYNDLVENEIHTFRDSEELEKGGDLALDLAKAIEESRIFLIIFSKNYAQSSWCLKELVKIMESRNMMQTQEESKVIPVFYHVEPSAVRKQLGSFEDAFVCHERDEEKKEMIPKWRSALKKAANLSGYDLNDQTPEAECIKKIRETIIETLDRTMGNDELNNQVNRLVRTKGRIQQSVDEANRQGDVIFPDVYDWLNTAQQTIRDTQEFTKNETEENRGCPDRRRKRAKLAGDISAKIQEAERIGGKVSHPPPPPPAIPSSSLVGVEALESRTSTLNQITEALRSDDIRMIGVWGMGGVGKTTLVKQVAKQADKGSFFDKVVIAYVSQTPNLANIQGEIASILGLKFEGGDDEARKAERLSGSLKAHKKILVILDNIWKKVDLGKIGIPYGDDHSGCKILLTSRRLHLLSKEMGSQKNFHVEHLCEEEAWSLFKKTAGDSVEKPELNSTATMVAKQCAGLPIAVVTVAKALRDEPLEVWREALRQLTRCIETDIEGIEDTVYLSLELSYNHLNSEKAKSLFLLCGLLDYGDSRIESLLRYGMGLGLFDQGINTLEEARNSLHAVIRNLKGASLLLESGVGDEYVRMHDVVRDVARAIASKDPHRFVVEEAVKMQQWPRWDGCRNCTRISLKCRDVQKLPEGLVCPNLEFFSLDNYDLGLEISDTFLDEAKELKVLGLSRVNLPRLHLSPHFPSNLRTLCLERCLINDIAIIGELKKLQIVSFAGSHIRQLPKEIMQVSDLRVLDLRNCKSLEVIPRNVISSLSRLEDLCIGNGFIKWEGEGVNSGESNVSLSELRHLSYLRCLDVVTPYHELLPQDLVFNNLNRFRISVGTSRLVWATEVSRSLYLCEVTRLGQLNCFSKLWKRTEDLELAKWRLQDVKLALCELEEEGFVELKRLSIRRCDGIEYLGNTMEGVPPATTSAFPILDDSFLFRLNDLEAVWRGPIMMASFGNLRRLRVIDCEKLKYVIVQPTGEGSEAVFPQLQELTLRTLPKLVSFNSTATHECLPFFNNHQDAFPNLEVLDIGNMCSIKGIWHNQHFMTGSFGKLRQVSVFHCENLSSIFSNSLTKSFSQLEKLQIHTSGVKEIIAKENGMEALAKFVFPMLTYLGLFELRELENFYPGKHTSKWSSLKELEMQDCDKVETLFEDISLEDDLNCPIQQSFFLIEKDGFPNLETIKLWSNKGIINIWRGRFSKESFSKLRVLKILECHGILVAIPCNMFQILHNLQHVFMSKCNSMKELIQATDVKVETLPQLTTVYLKHLPMLKQLYGFGLDPVLQNLQILAIKNCGNLINLLTPFMIKKFLQLKALVIDGCNMVEEMVGNEEGHEAIDDIVFTKLQRLILHDLPNLKSFCSVSYSFKFPFLEYIDIRRCPKMDVYCEGGFSAPRLKKVEMDEEKLDWEDDLNMGIHNKYMEKNAQNSKASQWSMQLHLDNFDSDVRDLKGWLDSK